MQNVKRIFAMFLVSLVVLTIFPAAALVPENETAESVGESDAAVSDQSDSVTSGEAPATEESLSIQETDPAQETLAPSETEAEASISENEAATESTEKAKEESVGTQDSLSTHIEKGNTSFHLNLTAGTTIPERSVLCVNALETTESQLDEICLKYDVPCVLDFFSFEMDVSGLEFSESTVPIEITFEDPFLMSIAPSAMMVFQYIDGAPVPIAMEATLSDAHATTRLLIEPKAQYFNGKYIVITTDAPNITLEVGTQVAYMAVNTINNKRVSLSGNGISFTTSGIMWHYISNQRDPAICLQPNKTFQTSNAAAYHVENTTLNGSSTGSVGGNVWNNLTKDQRRAIGLIILYGVKTNWVNSVGNAGLNTSYNLQYPTNPNQCLFAAQQIMAWEIITGNRSATYPYTCYNSTLINAFGGDVPTKYRWLEQQLQAHDNATSTIPSPEKSTFRLAWLSSGFQTVMQVVDIQYETPVPPTASLTIRKTSSTATGTNASKQFAFKIFSNSGLTNQVVATQYLAPGRSFSVTLDPDTTYYIAEVAENDWNCTTSGVSTKTVGGVRYDELSLDTLGDKKTALFLIMSDTDPTFNFLIAMIYTQLFNLLCEKADDVYGGHLPVHVRCLIDECANIGQIPNLEKLVATIRSREISACLVYQTKSQIKATYKDNADTIIGNMDTQLFLGGSEPTTLKDLSEALGKETIDSYNTSDTRGNSPSYGTNYTKLGKELMSRDELAVMSGSKCIVQLRGVRPFLSDKYDLTHHPNYRYTSDANQKNYFDVQTLLNSQLKLNPSDTYEVVETDIGESVTRYRG